MESALLRAGRPGITRVSSAVVPGGVAYLDDMELLRNKIATTAYEAAQAHAYRFKVQQTTAIDWLRARKLIESLPDGREFVPRDKMQATLSAEKAADPQPATA